MAPHHLLGTELLCLPKARLLSIVRISILSDGTIIIMSVQDISNSNSSI